MNEGQISQTPDELLLELIQTNAEKATKGTLDERLASLNVLIKELKTSTSSMTSVPKPLKHLIPYLENFLQAYAIFTDQDFLTKLADIISLLSIINIENNFDILEFRLKSPMNDIGVWGHEYVRCLTLSILKFADQNPLQPLHNELIAQISRYYMEHNDEPDAVDLLMCVGKLDDIIDLVDEESSKRVCIYLNQCFSYLPEPKNFDVLRVLIQIYKKHGEIAPALVAAMKLNDPNLVLEIFFRV